MLIACAECGKPVSSQAFKCPSCKGPTVKLPVWCAWVFFLIVLPVVVAGAMFLGDVLEANSLEERALVSLPVVALVLLGLLVIRHHRAKRQAIKR